MDRLRKRYEELLRKQGFKPGKGLAMTLTDEDLEDIEAHISEHFGSSHEIDPERTRDLFLEVHRMQDGSNTLDVEVLVEYRDNYGGIGVYFEVQHVDHKDVKEALSRLGERDEVKIHLKGKDSQEVSERLRDYFRTEDAEPEPPHEPGEMYEDKDFRCVDITIQNGYGLHMRPLKAIIEVTNSYDESTDIRIQKGREIADGRSILSVMTLCAEQGDTLTIKAKGPQAQEAIESMYRTIEELRD